MCLHGVMHKFSCDTTWTSPIHVHVHVDDISDIGGPDVWDFVLAEVLHDYTTFVPPLPWNPIDLHLLTKHSLFVVLYSTQELSQMNMGQGKTKRRKNLLHVWPPQGFVS